MFMLKIASPMLVLLCTSWVHAAVINVEFKFTPFTGDPAKADQVETVPGKARVFINNVALAEQEVRKEKVPVIFAEREIAPSVWVPMASLGPGLRKGKNSIRIEFEPADPKLAYRAQLRWASVTDGETRNEESGRVSATNQSGEGVDDKQAKGKSVFEREFTADFAKDLPWHHYPPVTSLTDQDKQQLAALAKARAESFRPDFALAYRLLDGKEGLHTAEIKQLQCLEKAYAAGVRVPVTAAAQLVFATTGNPEVVVERKGGDLFGPADKTAYARIKGSDIQMCAAIALSVAYPARLVFVRTPAGEWELAY
jgi:hypothetical protein